jgi:hypothetical protein|tara:strand:- start:420 stop:716 length:297 start_codon:yes stop_codon:yes gene_type:complete
MKLNEDVSPIPEKYIKRVTSTIPFGYRISDISGWLKPVDSELESLDFISKMVANEELSLRLASEWLEHKTNRTMSARGLQKHVDKLYGRRDERLANPS